ncbi:MAG: hypothetical protein JSU72_15265 [Deltaproteobacteria bacterium]|nr:MAG: hypothetical protein JSU72_15265 [Deltaproteobacteria bacterium]
MFEKIILIGAFPYETTAIQPAVGSQKDEPGWKETHDVRGATRDEESFHSKLCAHLAGLAGWKYDWNKSVFIYVEEGDSRLQAVSFYDNDYRHISWHKSERLPQNFQKRRWRVTNALLGWKDRGYTGLQGETQNEYGLTRSEGGSLDSRLSPHELDMVYPETDPEMDEYAISGERLNPTPSEPMSLQKTIGFIAKRLAWGQSREEILADIPAGEHPGESMFFWAWQAATYVPARHPHSSWGEDSFRAHVVQKV